MKEIRTVQVEVTLCDRCQKTATLARCEVCRRELCQNCRGDSPGHFKTPRYMSATIWICCDCNAQIPAPPLVEALQRYKNAKEVIDKWHVQEEKIKKEIEQILNVGAVVTA